MDHHQRGKRLGQRLSQEPRQRCGRRGPGLRGGDAGHGNVVPDAFIDHVDRILAEAQRRDDRADVRFDEGARGKRARAAGGDVEHLDNRGNVFGQGKGRRGRFRGVAQQGIDCVDVEIERVRHVGCDTTSGVPADIGKRVLQSGKVVQVTQGRRAVNMRVQIQRLNRRTAGAKVNTVATDFDGP